MMIFKHTVHPQKLRWNLRKAQKQKEKHQQTINFGGSMLVFGGVSHLPGLRFTLDVQQDDSVRLLGSRVLEAESWGVGRQDWVGTIGTLGVG